MIKYNILVSEYCINIIPCPPLPLESRSCWETGFAKPVLCARALNPDLVSFRFVAAIIV